MSIGERLWEMGKSPPQQIGLLVFGLAALLAALLASTMVGFAGAGALALALAASALLGIGGFFVTLALFLAAFASSGDGVPAVAWRVALLLAAVLVLLFVFA